MDIQKWQQEFVNSLKSRSRASATVTAYGQDINQLINYLEKQGVLNLKDVKKENLEGFLASLSKQGYTAKSVSRKINSIKTFFRFLIVQNTISENPALTISHPKIEAKSPRILSQMEYRALRDACREDVRISAIVELLLQTGLRIGELAALKVSDIKDNSIIIPSLENHPQREVPLNRAAKTALTSYVASRPQVKNESLFITKTGRPFLIRNIRTAIDRYFKLAGIKEATVNDLRHTFVAYHLASGASPVLISKLVGHKRISTTEKYLEYIKDLPLEKVKLEEL